CAEAGYRAVAVVAEGRFTARALARHAEAAFRVVPPAQAGPALAPLPLTALEAMPRARAALGALGLTTLGEVAALPRGAVVARLGAEGLCAQRLARGED